MSIENEILALEKKFWQSMIDKDGKTGASLIAEPSLVTGSQGVVRLDRKTFEKMTAEGKWQLHAYEFSDVKVEEIADGVAVIAYKVKEDVTVEGKRMTMEAADASTWVRKGGDWVCALHTESVLGDPFGRDRKPADKPKAA